MTSPHKLLKIVQVQIYPLSLLTSFKIYISNHHQPVKDGYGLADKW